MKNRNHLMGYWVNGSQVGSFVEITAIASEREVFRIVGIRSVMLRRDDVLDVECGFYRVLRQSTVFTTVARTGRTSWRTAGVMRCSSLARHGPST